MTTKEKNELEAPTVVRLSVNLAEDAMNVLKGLAKRRGMSYTETIRRAITVLKFVEDEMDKGHKLAVVEKDPSGQQTVREILLVG